MADEDDIEIDFGSDEAAAEPEDTELNLDFGDDDEADAAPEVEIDFGPEADGESADDDIAVDDADESDQTTDEAVEKALEELRAELRAKPGEWYVVHTYSGMEKRVKQNLESRAQSLNMEDFIFEVRVPTEEAVEIRNGNRKTVTRTVLPGYVLVCMDMTDESWATVRHTPSVTGFVGHATQPVTLSMAEVEQMLAPAVIAAATAKVEPAKQARRKKIEVADFAVGDSVLITDGPFAGVHASITEINANSQRLKALVDFMGRETPVDLTFAQVEKV
ncbi:MAG: transcription termination/antitermination protein NusG [Propionibacteriaceae bacterium]|nr:transcription termination/antitermination protein NusG [Propionibacteriaceae bacterium]